MQVQAALVSTTWSLIHVTSVTWYYFIKSTVGENEQEHED